MSRVKRGTTTHARHKKLLKSAKGYVGSKSKLYRVASEQKLHSLSYAYRDRRTKKRDFRQLWIVRLNAAARKNGMTYSQLIKQLNTNSIKINRKILALVAWHYPETFTSIVQKVNK